MVHFDCQACGVCCRNTEKNLELQSRDYIEITRTDRLYNENKELLVQVGVRNDKGDWHMKLVDEDQHCIALEGEFERGVGCTIYPWRPKGCRIVESGDEECLKARRRYGLPLTWPEEKARLLMIEMLDD